MGSPLARFPEWADQRQRSRALTLGAIAGIVTVGAGLAVSVARTPRAGSLPKPRESVDSRA
jgi:hypothetical protein